MYKQLSLSGLITYKITALTKNLGCRETRFPEIEQNKNNDIKNCKEMSIFIIFCFWIINIH